MNTSHSRSALAWLGAAILSLAAAGLLAAWAVKGGWSWPVLALACGVGVASILLGSARPSLADAAQVKVAMDGHELCIEGAGGEVQRMTWSKLERVYIQTAGVGSPAEEMMWVLMTAQEEYAIPAGAAGAADLLTQLRQLPQFDNAVVLRAMRATDAQSLLCWQRRK